MILGVEILILCVLHYIGDFLLQTDEMAINKSSSNEVLTDHVNAYMSPFSLFYAIYTLLFLTGIGALALALFAIIINFLLHWIIDYNTSRATARYHQAGERSKFFKMIGFDQLLHHLSFIGIHLIVFEVVNG